MERMKSTTLAMVILCSALLSGQTSSKISGVVRDSARAVIANAEVAIHWNCRVPKGPDAPKSNDVIIKTDNTGQYSLAVAPGFYDVCAHPKAFSPSCTTVRAEEGQNAVYNPQLKPNPVIAFPD